MLPSLLLLRHKARVLGKSRKVETTRVPACVCEGSDLYTCRSFGNSSGCNVPVLQVFCLPPLIITPKQIQEGFEIFDKCLDIMDEAMVD